MIKFKRQGGGTSSSASAIPPTSLKYGEPAISSDGILYVGDGSGNVVSKVKNSEYSNSSKNDIHLYKATFLLDNWTGEDQYTQTVPVYSVDNGPDITTDSTMQSPVMIDDNFDKNVYGDVYEGGSIINTGTKTLGNGTITCVTRNSQKPKCDVEILFLSKNSQ